MAFISFELLFCFFTIIQISSEDSNELIIYNISNNSVEIDLKTSEEVMDSFELKIYRIPGGLMDKQFFHESNDYFPLKVRGLTPGAQYKFKILLYYSFNYLSEVHKEFTTVPNQPRSPSCLDPRENEDLLVTWSKPDGFYDSFLVRLISGTNVIISKIINKHFKRVFFKKLSPGTQYTISVQTVSDNQKSNPLEFNCSTNPDQILDQVTNLAFDPEKLYSDSFVIRWTAPSYEKSYKGYILFIDGKFNKKLQKDVDLVKVGGAEPGRTYMIGVTTLSDIGQSIPVQIFITTRPLPVLNLTAKAGETDILVNWTVNNTSSQNSFRVNYRLFDVNKTENSIEVKENSIHLVDLKPGSSYYIEVMAISNNISSEAIGIKQLTEYPNSLATICGISRLNQTTDNLKRILKGINAERSEFPWHVMLWNYQRKAFCGGTLLNERWIITAAHCFGKVPVSTIEIKLGKYDQTEFEKTEIVTKIDGVVIHPDFSRKTLDNDIALVRLSQHIPLTPYIRPICLVERGERRQFDEIFLNSNSYLRFGYVCGWGVLGENRSQSRILQETKLPVVNQNKCRSSSEYEVTINMFCAGYGDKGSSDACEGDSGGAFIVSYKSRWTILGVVSWGEGCGRSGKYGFYTRINNYLDWIYDIITIKKITSPTTTTPTTMGTTDIDTSPEPIDYSSDSSSQTSTLSSQSSKLILSSVSEKCRQTGVQFVPHSDCNLYYWCVHQKPILQSCPKDTVWDNTVNRCEWSFNLNNDNCFNQEL